MAKRNDRIDQREGEIPMDNEGKNGAQTDKQAVLGRLRDTKALYVVVSACTKLPYVVCDPETFDDEVLVFFKPEEAEAKAKSLAWEKIPVSIVKLENKQLLLFYTNLYTMGVNAIFVADSGKEELIQLEEFVRRRGDEPGEEDKVWVENPALHLTALYYMQEARRQPGPEMNSRLMELQEEIEMHFRKGTFILAIQKEGNGIPLVKMKNGDVYQAAFTDILEFQKFNRENKFRPVAADADKLAVLVAPEAKGVVLNIMSLNLPFNLNRKPAVPAEGDGGEKKSETV